MNEKTKNRIVWVVVIAALVAYGFFMRSCGIRSVTKTEGTVVEVRKDSIVYTDRPVPYRVDSLVFVKGKDGKIIYDTLWPAPEVIIEPADTVAILKRFNETAYYKREKDTGRVKVTIMDTVFQNRLAGGSVKVVFSDTVTTKTIVLKPPQRMVGYITGAVMGKPRDPFYGAGAGFTLKTPKDNLYGIKAKYIPDYGWTYEFEVGIPIRLIKLFTKK